MIFFGALLGACSPASGPVTTTTRFAAGAGARALLGVDHYDVTQSAGAADISLRDAAGAPLGTLTLTDAQSSVMVAALAAPDGSSATERAFVTFDDGGGFSVRRRLEAAGQSLEYDVTVGADGAPARVALATGTAGATADGGLLDGEGFGRAVVALDGAAAISNDALFAWLDASGLGALLATPAARALWIVLDDPALAAGLAGPGGAASGALRIGGATLPASIAERRQAVSSTDCTASSALIGAASASCVACSAALIALPATAGLSEIIAVVSCALCGANLALALWTDLQCKKEGPPKSQDDCNQFCLASRGSAFTAQVAPDGKSCSCKCSVTACIAKLKSELLEDQTFCSAVCDGDQCKGQVQTCGDGVVDHFPGCDPEACDDNAHPSGCAPGRTCVNCHCLANSPDAGAPDDAGVDGGTPGCENVVCDPGDTCIACPNGPYCGPPGSTCCAGATCPPGQACQPCGDSPYCESSQAAICCNPAPGIYFTCGQGEICCQGVYRCLNNFDHCPAN